MKIISLKDLFIKVANNELEDETKFKYNGHYYKYWKYSKQFDKYTDNTYSTVDYYDFDIFDLKHLDDEVLIIDDDTIEYIDYLDFKEYSDEDKMWCLVNKINEIIKKGEHNE